MKCNIGKADRLIRIIAGLGLITWGIATQNPWGAIGLVPILTGLIRWCPAYVPFKISTNK